MGWKQSSANAILTPKLTWSDLLTISSSPDPLKYNGKLLIKPARKNVKRFLAKIRTIIKTSGAKRAGQLLVRLNPSYEAGLTITATSSASTPSVKLAKLASKPCGVGPNAGTTTSPVNGLNRPTFTPSAIASGSSAVKSRANLEKLVKFTSSN